MNFEQFQNLLHRVTFEWLERAKPHNNPNIANYLSECPFTAKHTKANEEAYEELMDIRMQLLDLSREIDENHDGYMEYCRQTMDSPDLMDKLTRDLNEREKHLMQLELMILEQVSDWERDVGKDTTDPRNKPKSLVVHLPNGATHTINLAQSTAQRRYWFGMCAVSSKIGEMRLCAGCKVVGYLGKDEQKDDWPNHKQLCKVLKAARAGKDHWIANFNAEQMQDKLREALGRPLTQYEIDLTQFPRICGLCNKGQDQSGLETCQKCFCAAFCKACKSEGETRHCKYCAALKFAAEDYRNEVTVGHQVQDFEPKTATRYEPLEVVGDIEALFTPEIENLVSKKLPGYADSELRHITFMYSCPLTVLYGAEKSDIDVQDASQLVVHVLGARRAEIRHISGWDVIATRLPRLRLLKLVFIGDESESEELNLPQEFSYKSKELQVARPELKVVYRFEPRMLYQDYCQNKARFCEPDLAVALDCGFKFYPSWLPALDIILKKATPLVFTEFTRKDQEDNVALLRNKFKADIVLDVQKNPFCSTRPFRCSDKSGNYEPNSVFYTNDYIAIAKGKSSC